MTRLLLFLTIVAFCTNISNSISAELKCNISENKCTQINVDKSKKNIYEYIGAIKNGKAEGKGKFYLINEPKISSEGIYTTNKINEIILITGVIHLPEGDYFLKNKNIYKIVYKNGQILEGTFDKETRIIKEGTQSFPNTKEKFTGKFNEGAFKEGTFIFSDGTKFIGTYEGNRPKKGFIIYNNGETFSGSFINVTKLTYIRNEGIYKLKDGSRYEGSFFKDGKYRSGTYYFKDGRKTVFAEAVQITFDKSKTNLDEIFKVFFTVHDPTTLNRQGEDEGTQYRSVIFYKNEAQKLAAQTIITALKKGKVYDSPIVTTLEPFTKFYEAEKYHQNYFEKNKDQPYCQMVIQPKLDKFEKIFKDRLKKKE
jgi:peptide-methionine (S)-S-oxide reductase/peptide methionine sulfoxide reductase msrA/msrB